MNIDMLRRVLEPISGVNGVPSIETKDQLNVYLKERSLAANQDPRAACIDAIRLELRAQEKENKVKLISNNRDLQDCNTGFDGAITQIKLAIREHTNYAATLAAQVRAFNSREYVCSYPGCVRGFDRK